MTTDQQFDIAGQMYNLVQAGARIRMDEGEIYYHDHKWHVRFCGMCGSFVFNKFEDAQAKLIRGRNEERK